MFIYFLTEQFSLMLHTFDFLFVCYEQIEKNNTRSLNN